MGDTPVSFPVYRHYADRLTWFRIDSPEQAYELKRMGAYYSITRINATQYPERMFINDLLQCTGDHIVASTAVEYERVKQQWKQDLVKREI